MPNVSLTYSEIETLASQLRAGEDRITTDLSTLRSLVQQLVDSGFVTEYASPQFNETYQGFTSNATKMIEELKVLAQYLDTAVRTFREVDEQLRRAAQQ
jgi:WXG100 family type VII secretion target